MKANNKKALIAALDTAAELIRGQHESGGEFGCDDFTHDEYVEAAKKVSKMILKMAAKYQISHNNK